MDQLKLIVTGLCLPIWCVWQLNDFYLRQMIEFIRSPFLFPSISLEPEFGVARFWFRILSGKVYKSRVGLRIEHMKREKAYNFWSVLKAHFWRKGNTSSQRHTRILRNSGNCWGREMNDGRDGSGCLFREATTSLNLRPLVRDPSQEQVYLGRWNACLMGIRTGASGEEGWRLAGEQQDSFLGWCDLERGVLGWQVYAFVLRGTLRIYAFHCM